MQYSHRRHFFFVFIFFGLSWSLTATGGEGNDPVSDAIIVFDAGANAEGDLTNAWHNTGTLAPPNGPGWLDPQSPGAKPTLVSGTPSYYESNGKAWGSSPPSGFDPYVNLADFTYEIWLRRTSETLGGSEIQISGLFMDPMQTAQFLRFNLAYGDEPSSNAILDFDILGDGGAWDTQSGLDLVEFPVVAADGPFTQIVIAWSNDTQQYNVYKDGASVRDNVQSSTSALNGSIDMGVWGIFKTQSTEGDSRAFPGDIPLVRLYDRQLNAAEVLQNFGAFENATIAAGVDFSVQANPETAVVTFNSRSGGTYNLQISNDLTATSESWTTVGATITGNGEEMQMHDPAASNKNNYRVVKR